MLVLFSSSYYKENATRQKNLDLVLGVCGIDLVIGLEGHKTSSLGKRFLCMKRVNLITKT